tara:strand:+ start:991 stop:3357 length:2367 start_codon:yes stop_codon:yes gene_type:complete
MKVLLSWLKEFAPEIEGDPVSLGERLSHLGLAVEDISILGEGLEGVVVGRILELRPHPDAERIQLVDVDLGDGNATQICCGAFNMKVGDYVPVATIGSILPDGLEISQRKLRGELSNGMCCSPAELGLGDDHDGIMILPKNSKTSSVGSPIAEVLGIQRDVLWDLEVNANRPDAMSVAGVARDLAASLGIPFMHPDYGFSEGSTKVSDLSSVEIIDPTLCGRFAVRAALEISIGDSPRWIQNRLISLGMRPINNVVDISNYVMLELGQPNHTYDLAKVPEGHLSIRRASGGETITTLDGEERSLISEDGVIANIRGEAIGIAGVMGGISTEISEKTTDVLIEVAWWDPPSISRTVKRLNLMSEASMRFRRGADYGDNIERSLDRIGNLLSDSGAEIASGVEQDTGHLPSRDSIKVRTNRINNLLGVDLSAKDMKLYLESIGFEASVKKGDLSVTIPTWRWDTETETDISEEVARMFGYENIRRSVPKGTAPGALTEYQKNRRRVREILVGVGCDETMPMPFLAPGDLRSAGLPEEAISLTNPLVQEESLLRTSLLPGQLKVVAYNQSHRVEGLRLFEIGHVFLASSDEVLPDEREHLSVALIGVHVSEIVDLLYVLGNELALPNLQLASDEILGMHPGRAAEILVAGKPCGVIGEVDPRVLMSYGIDGRVAWLELNLGKILSGPLGKKSYRSVSKYPSSDVDLAFDVPETVSSASIFGYLRKAGGDLLQQVKLFDAYAGDAIEKGHRSLAYRLRFQASDRTLTDDEVSALRSKCIQLVEKKTAARLRL